MNLRNSQILATLITEYETMKQKGQVALFDEKDYRALVEYYEQEDQIDRALEVIDQAIDHFSYSAEFYIKKAHLFILNSQQDLALLILDHCIALAPNDPKISLLKARAYVQLNLLDDALSLLDELRAESDGHILSEVYFLEALAYEQYEQYERMYYSLKASLKENPANLEAIEKLGTCIEAIKKYEEAIDIYELLINEHPYNHLAWFYLGHAQAYLGNYLEAIDAYEYSYITNEQFEFGYRECAELCFELQLFERALNCYEEMQKHFVQDSDVLLRLGQCSQYLKRYDTAKVYYRQAIKMDPLNDEALFHTGECRIASQDWQGAIRAIEKALHIEDQREDYYSVLGTCYNQLGNLEAAETNFKRAIEIAPEQGRYWIQLVHLLLEEERGEEALDFIIEADEFDMDTELMYCHIASLFAVGRRQEAMYRFGEALEEDFESHKVLFELLPTLENDSGIITLLDTHSY